MLDDFAAVARSLRYRPPQRALVSGVTGELADPSVIAAPDYWVEHVRAPVRFADAVCAAVEQGAGSFLEIGATAPLLPMIRATHSEVPATAVAPGRRDESGDSPDGGRGTGTEALDLVTALARLHVAGTAVDWDPLLPAAPVTTVDLPTYPFAHQRFWPEIPPTPSAGPGAAFTSTGHPWLTGTTVLAGTDTRLVTGVLDRRRDPWLDDHAVGGRVIVAGALWLEAALTIADLLEEPHEVGELVVETVLDLPATAPVSVQAVVDTDETGGGIAGTPQRVVFAAAGEDATWTRYAHARLIPVVGDGDRPEPVTAPAGNAADAAEAAYEALAERGFAYGPGFRAGTTVETDADGTVRAILTLPEGLSSDGYALHPALLDAAAHAVLLAGPSDAAAVPFSWSGVRMFATGARTLHVAVAPLAASTPDSPGGDLRITATDPAGDPVLRIDRLTVRPLPENHHNPGVAEDLRVPGWVRWDELTGHGEPASAVVTLRPGDIAAETTAATIVLDHRAADRTDPVGDGHAAVADLLAAVQAVTAEPGRRLVVLTAGAIGTGYADPVTDPTSALLQGFGRSVASEHPGAVLLLDARGDDAEIAAAISAMDGGGHREAAVRDGALWIPHAPTVTRSVHLVAPDEPWRLDSPERGVLDALALLPAPEAAATLPPGRVRLRVEAAGVNFRDVLIGLDLYPGAADMGAEAAGTVVEVADDVTDLAVGDRVVGLVPHAVGPLAVADARQLVAVPDGWTTAQAAGVPVAYLTAYRGLVDLAAAAPGERLLVHAAAGGVGQAAIQLAGHLGLEVWATAHPDKAAVVERLGVDPKRIASSRDTAFTDDFPAMDIVLGALSGELVDASLRVLTRGGRYLEMGKTDVRDAEAVTADHPGVSYLHFDMLDAGPDRIGEMTRAVADLVETGVLAPLPVTTAPVSAARTVFRDMSAARHTGKLVLEPPRPVDVSGTVLVTGATGGVGDAVAEHLANAHGARRMLLVARRGAAAPGADELAGRLRAAGAEVELVAADVADPDAVTTLLAPDRPGGAVSAVVHCAGTVEDATVATLTPEAIDRVLAAKLDAAWNLHTHAGPQVGTFLLFSSVAGVLGTAGQAAYAAANAFLDALAAYRRARGLPAQSISWGLWGEVGGMAGELEDADRARVARSGVLPLTTSRALSLLDAALAQGEPHVLAARLGPAVTAARPVGLPRAPRAAEHRTASSREDLAGMIARLGPEDGRRHLLAVVRRHAADVLGHAGAGGIGEDRGFLDLGFDSLTAVEFRNRLTGELGIELSTTVVFDHPTPGALADALAASVVTTPGDTAAGARPGDPHEAVDVLAALLADAPPSVADADALRGRLRTLDRELVRIGIRAADETDGTDGTDGTHRTDARGAEADGAPETDTGDGERDADEEMFALIDRELGRG